MAFGTLFTLDSVAELDTIVADIDMDRLWDNLSAYFEAHSLLFNEAMEMVAERTTDRLRRIGDVDQMEAQELDEFGRADAQKMAQAGYNIGFPLRRYGAAIQWTADGFENMTVRQFTEQVNGITDADERALYRELRRGIFTPTNRTFKDWQVTPTVDLPVKALLNADGEPIPTGPSAQEFDGSTHTHYLGVTTSNAPTQGEAEGAIEHAVEHFNSGNVLVYINRAEEGDVNNFADFKEYKDVRLIDQRNEIVAGGTLDMNSLYDRAIGLLHGAEFWVKPWVPAGYWVIFVQGPQKPLVLREHPRSNLQGLRLVRDVADYPLHAREWEHRFGVGVWNRPNGVVLDVSTGGGTYTAPVF